MKEEDYVKDKLREIATPQAMLWPHVLQHDHILPTSYNTIVAVQFHPTKALKVPSSPRRQWTCRQHLIMNHCESGREIQSAYSLHPCPVVQSSAAAVEKQALVEYHQCRSRIPTQLIHTWMSFIEGTSITWSCR